MLKVEGDTSSTLPAVGCVIPRSLVLLLEVLVTVGERAKAGD